MSTLLAFRVNEELPIPEEALSAEAAWQRRPDTADQWVGQGMVRATVTTPNPSIWVSGTLWIRGRDIPILDFDI